jgi:hypothetical protein
MITEIKTLPKQTNEQIAFEKLIKIFNLESDDYKIILRYGYPHLAVKRFFDWKILNQIYWNEMKDEYSFLKGLDEKTFKEIKHILERLNLRFKIELC